jgi:hypothetical protein
MHAAYTLVWTSLGLILETVEISNILVIISPGYSYDIYRVTLELGTDRDVDIL